MSILIRGIEMPTSCKECRLTYDSSWCLLLDEPNECVKGGLMWKRCAETGRLEDCPLDPVQPHGRLIDADALMEHCIDLPKEGGYMPIVYKSYITNAPTIIEAEVKE